VLERWMRWHGGSVNMLGLEYHNEDGFGRFVGPPMDVSAFIERFEDGVWHARHVWQRSDFWLGARVEARAQISARTRLRTPPPSCVLDAPDLATKFLLKPMCCRGRWWA
jgi:hypothetical protein